MKNLQKGRSMVEMLGVLGIMAMVTALGIIAYTQAMKMFKGNSFKEEVAKIVQTARAYYATRENAYTDLNNDNLVKISGVNLAKSSFGNGYKVLGDTTDPLKFTVTATGLSSSECDQILAMEFEGAEVKADGTTPEVSCDTTNGFSVTYR